VLPAIHPPRYIIKDDGRVALNTKVADLQDR
jgi:hypothetical protein